MHFEQKRNLRIEKELYLSDQCACQYKCKSAFYLFSLNNNPVVHSNFGSGHGKSLMDGEGAVIKTHVDSKVKSELITVQTAKDFMEACKDLYDEQHVHELHGEKHVRTVLL